MRLPEFRFYYFTPRYEQTVAFYHDTLGFSVYHSWSRGEGDRGTIFRSPNGIGLIEIEAGAEPPPLRGGFYFEVPDVADWHERVRAMGAPIAKPLTDTDYGHRNFKTVDPNGVEVAFFSYVIVPPHVGEPHD
jgi:predicted enzyme related to lactoylglutathione lyase